MTVVADTKLQAGNLYRLRYRLQSGNYKWYVWEMTAVYIGSEQGGYKQHFSLRPHAGSTQIQTSHIHEVELVAERVDARSSTVKTVMPKRIGPVRKPR